MSERLGRVPRARGPGTARRQRPATGRKPGADRDASGSCGSLAEQAVLEDLLEACKPRLPQPAADLHYLLATPFRYPPLQVRFAIRSPHRAEPVLCVARASVPCWPRPRITDSCSGRAWQTAPTAPLTTQHSCSAPRSRPARGLRLQRPPFDEFRPARASLRVHGDPGAGHADARSRRRGLRVSCRLATRTAASTSRCSRRTRSRLANPSFVQPWLCETNGRSRELLLRTRSARPEFALDTFTVDGRAAGAGRSVNATASRIMTATVPPSLRIATATGRAGIGVVRVSGPASRAIARALLGDVPPPRARDLAHASWIATTRRSTLGWCSTFRGPVSYTGEDMLELQGHGGADRHGPAAAPGARARRRARRARRVHAARVPERQARSRPG